MLNYIINFFITPVLIGIPIYFGYNLYTGKYNDFLFDIILKKVEYELYFKRNIDKLLTIEEEDEEKEDDVDEFKLYYNGEIILHAPFNESIKKCKDYPLQLYVKTINKIKNIYRLDNSENKQNVFNSEMIFENKLDSPFLQVELKQGGEKILLDKGLSDFYFNGNKILDEIFLKWFLNYYNYGVELQEEYTIKIMDNDINFFELSNEDYIILNNNGFIKNGEKGNEENGENQNEKSENEENIDNFEYKTDI